MTTPSPETRNVEQEFKERVFDCTDDFEEAVKEEPVKVVVEESKKQVASDQASSMQTGKVRVNARPMPMPQQRPQPGDRVQPRANILEELPTVEHAYWTNTETSYLM